MNDPTPADLRRDLMQDLADAIAHPGLWRDGVLVCAAAWPAAIRRARAAERLLADAARLLSALGVMARRDPLTTIHKEALSLALSICLALALPPPAGQ